MPIRTRVLAFLLALAGPAAAQAEIIDIAWSAQGRFERRVSVPPGTCAEVCGRLVRADAVAWRFDASGPLHFSIHDQEGKDIRYPERRDARATASGRLQVALDQDDCRMWTNEAGDPVSLQLLLEQ